MQNNVKIAHHNSRFLDIASLLVLHQHRNSTCCTSLSLGCPTTPNQLRIQWRICWAPLAPTCLKCHAQQSTNQTTFKMMYSNGKITGTCLHHAKQHNNNHAPQSTVLGHFFTDGLVFGSQLEMEHFTVPEVPDNPSPTPHLVAHPLGSPCTHVTSSTLDAREKCWWANNLVSD